MICRKCQAICLNPYNYLYVGNVLNREYKCRCGYRFSTHEEFDYEIQGCSLEHRALIQNVAGSIPAAPAIKKAPA